MKKLFLLSLAVLLSANLFADTPTCKTLWSGSLSFGGWEKQLTDLSWYYDWTIAQPGDKLTVYFTVDESVGYTNLLLADGQWKALPTTTIDSRVDNNNNYRDFASSDTSVSIILSQADIDALLADNAGLVIAGGGLIINAVELCSHCQPLWSGNVPLGGDWTGNMSDLAWNGAYDWATIQPGTELTVYFTVDESVGYNGLRFSNGSWEPLPSTMADTNSDDNGYYCGFAALATSKTIVLRASDIAELVNNGGLLIHGAGLNILSIELCSSSKVGSIIKNKNLYYRITSLGDFNTVEVVHQDCYSTLSSIDIPETIIDDDYTFTVTKIGSSAFSGCSNLTSVTIPKSVMAIGKEAFYACSVLTSISVDAANTHYSSVDGVLFNYVKDTLIQYPKGNSRTEYSIPNSVTTIEDGVFESCYGLTSVTIPNSVTTIGNYVFYACTGLTSVTIPNSVTKIGNRAFGYVSNIVYNGSATGSPWGANCVNGYVDGYLVYSDASKTTLCGCSSSATGEIIIPNSVTTIGYGAFVGCDSLTSITIPNSVTTIEEEGFGWCSNLTSLIIPNSVTTIGNGAFYGSGLKDLEVAWTSSEQLPSIGEGIFEYIVNWEGPSAATLHVPAGTESIYENADQWKDFGTIVDKQPDPKNCVITYTATEKLPETTDTNTFGLHTNAFDVAITSHEFSNGTGTITFAGEVTTIGDYAFFGCPLTSIIIPNSVTTIGEGAFKECYNLTSITIPYSVTKIGKTAFFGCPLTSITIPNSVTTIEEGAFSWCFGLTSVTIPYSVTTIGVGAFEGSGALTSIDIPNSVTTIGDRAFSYCSGLTDVTVAWTSTGQQPTMGNGVFYGIANNVGPSGATLYVPAGTKAIYQAADQWKDFGTITEPKVGDQFIIDGVYYEISSIGSNNTVKVSWYDRDLYITPLVIPASVSYGNYTYTVTEINSWAFNGAIITSIDLPNTLITIGEGAFCGCYGLTSINIPNSVTTIGNMAFHSCSSLTSVTIPNSVTTIGEGAFYQCHGLTSVTIPNSVTTIGGWAFANCSSLTSINVDINNTHYCSIDGVLFSYAKDSLIQYPKGNTRTEYSIPNSVTTIGDYAFYSCTGLTEVTIPSSVTTIGDGVFYGCTGLTSITSFAVNPPLCGTNCFEDVSKSIPIYVPFNSVNAYKQADEWKEFANIQRNPYDYATVSCSTTNGTISGAGKYVKGDTCTLTVTPNYGYHFVQWNDNVTDNPRVFVIAQDTSFTAQIDINQYQLTVQSLDSTKGTVTGSGYYDYKSQPTISAIPKEHYHFLQWNDGSPVNPRKFTITQDTTFVAEFAPNNYQVTVTSADPNMGSCLGSGSFVYLSEQSISAKANYGYHFDSWNDGLTDNPRTIQVLSDTTFTAEFAKNVYTISTQAEHGSISGGGDYEYLTPIQLTATADEHYHFVQWSDGNTNNPRQITIEEDKTYTAIFSIDQHSISTIAEHGIVNGTGIYDYGSETILTIIPDFGYEFSSWADGNTNNPRTILVTEDATYSSMCVLMVAGACGNNLYWNYRAGKLTITGSGTMYNYSFNEVPWILYRDSIQQVELCEGLTHVGNNAFASCPKLTTLVIPNSVTTIGESTFENCNYLKIVTLGKSLTEIGCNAFKGDYRIEEITSYAEVTPNVCTTTFDGLSKQYIYLYVPENSIRSYQVDPNWNGFDIRSKVAETQPIDGDEPIVTPSNQDVTITWPITDGTDTYTLTITKNGEVVCVLTFNANGQLINIAFAAPGHDGSRQAPAVTLTAQGYQFTVTGLTPGTAYNYSVVATDAGGKTVAEHTGNFSTTGGATTNIDWTQDIKHQTLKYLHNGQLLIDRNGQHYSAMGERIR